MKAPPGAQALLVVLLEFPDSPHDATHDPAYFEDLIFGRDPSVKGYFEEVSYSRGRALVQPYP
jgi:hypothetical protein